MGTAAFHTLPHILDANILLRNTAQNRLLVWDWLSMALVRPDGFCASHPQDQAAWALLTQSRGLPFVNFCPYLDNYHFGAYVLNKTEWDEQGKVPWCSGNTKNPNVFLTLLKSGRYE